MFFRHESLHCPQAARSHTPSFLLPMHESSANFFKVGTYDKEYWDTYISARPKYDGGRFYERIFEYHAAHSASSESWDSAHDIGTGPGNVAAMLLTRFNKVVASDPNAMHLDIAQHRLAAAAVDMSRISFIEAAGEAIADHFPAGSADLITAAECLPLMDADAAVSCFARMLRPGGTLAIWFYGRPIIAASTPNCQVAFNRLLNHAFRLVITEGQPGWKRATDRLASWLDDVAFPAGQWEAVERWKWNPTAPLVFHEPETVDAFPVERTSRIDAKRENIFEVEDKAFWAERWDAAGVRRFITVILPGVKAHIDGTDSTFEALFAELEKAMGGPEVVHDITWPVILLLATRTEL
ncbi:S-adenosyl-L-methionine-dependent methyltransferase [Mycena capillaripes]|nr:S-adenosyl-L-methionine-dependent methyltransferase [Mycena capillaripes]